MNTLYIDDRISESGTGGETMQVVAFKVSGSTFAIDIAHVNSIIMPQDVTDVPRTPEFVTGVINLRGRIVPILDMRERFSLQGSSGTVRLQERILVVEVDGITAGLTVDSVSEVLHLPLSRLQPPSEVVKSADNDCIKGIGRTDDDRLLIVLDVAKTLTCSTSGIDALQELQDRVNRPARRKKAA